MKTKIACQHVRNFYTSAWLNKIYDLFIINNFCHDATAPSRPGLSHFPPFTITFRHTTLGSTPLDVWSACRTDLYLTAYNIHTRQTSTTPAGFEPEVPASGRPQTHTLDRAPPRIGVLSMCLFQIPFVYHAWIKIILLKIHVDIARLPCCCFVVWQRYLLLDVHVTVYRDKFL